MNRNTFICGLVMLIASGCAHQKADDKTVLGMGTDYVYFPETLTGKIKELRETNYWAIEKDGKITKGSPVSWKELDSVGSTKNFTAHFDEMGNLTQYDLVDENNVVRNSNIGKIQNGRLIRLEFKSKDSTTQYATASYDSRGYFAGGKIFHPYKDTLLLSFIITNNEQGKYTKLEYFDFKNQKGRYMTFALNDQGKVYETKFFNKYDTLKQTFHNSYNGKGFLATQTAKTEKPESVVTWEVQDLLFDDHNNWLQCYSNVDKGKFKLLAERTYVYY